MIMKRIFLIVLIAAISMIGAYSFSLAQKEDESRPHAHILHYKIAGKLEDMIKMVTEMQREMEGMSKMIDDSHAGMNSEELDKMDDRMVKTQNRMKQIKQQLSDMHQEMMKEGG